MNIDDIWDTLITVHLNISLFSSEMRIICFFRTIFDILCRCCICFQTSKLERCTQIRCTYKETNLILVWQTIGRSMQKIPFAFFVGFSLPVGRTIDTCGKRVNIINILSTVGIYFVKLNLHGIFGASVHRMRLSWKLICVLNSFLQNYNF